MLPKNKIKKNPKLSNFLLQLHSHCLSQCIVWMHFSSVCLVGFFSEPTGLASEVFYCPSTEKGENYLLHQEKPSLFPLPSFPSNCISKVHIAECC